MSWLEGMQPFQDNVLFGRLLPFVMFSGGSLFRRYPVLLIAGRMKRLLSTCVQPNRSPHDSAHLVGHAIGL